FGRRDDITIIKSKLLIGAGGGEDAARGDELPAVEQPAEALVPLVCVLAFDGGDAAGDAFHHLLRDGFNGLRNMLGEAVDLRAIAQFDGDTARAAGGFRVQACDDADLALAS